MSRTLFFCFSMAPIVMAAAAPEDGCNHERRKPIRHLKALKLLIAV